MTHPLGSPFVREHLSLRTLPANDRPLRAERPYVLYWMQSTQRLEDNWALRLATAEADRVNKPLLVLQVVDTEHRYASARFHTFVLQGARDLAARAAARGLTYRLMLCRRRGDPLRTLERVAAQAALVVTDQFPTEGVPARTAALAARIDCRLLAVDSVGIVPAACFLREEYAPRTMRPKLWGLLDHAAEAVEDRAPKRPFPTALLDQLQLDPVDLRRSELVRLVAACDVDRRVGAVSMEGGLSAARERLGAFVGGGLREYARRRSNPSDGAGTSRLSPYLHYGMISPLEVFGTVRAAGSADETEAFLDEMLTWRELALNFCLRNPEHHSLASLPAWARRTMAAHAADERPVTYTLEELERAETHDAIWNAGQRELMETGVMHPIVRMLWGKAVLAWAPTYDDAFAWLLHLNDRYGLDGRDPASYAGIQWCFGKFDRPFSARPVWGAIRPMSLERARAKYELDDYVARWQPAPVARVA
jgi:photolyase PhrII